MKIGDIGITQQNHYLNQAQKSQEKALENIAAMRAINGTDGSNLAIADSLRSQYSTIDQGILNAYDSVGILQIADSTLNNISTTADKLNELSVRSNNAALNDRQKNILNTEANKLVSSINSAFSNATFNGKNVFQSMDFVVGIGVESINLNQPSTANLSLENQDGIRDFQDQVSSLRADIGVGINAIHSNINSSLQTSINTKEAESKLQNNDLAQNINDFNTNYLKENAFLFANAHSNVMLQTKLAGLLQ
ncbi:flagellar secreted protein [Campylobacter subantarcticus LMG 24377]|uniref:Flagellar secreted protein n=2 Tax=Campylobacter subantarcticus TaxID=497724 RepID=A0A0A8H8R2_9BACT|nr:flagellin [Campylobacter subantarcticus]EAJ1261124.1 flagellin [Campylobacter lari]AJC90461.1 flagellar secreted protein [Campylobacter subantarcticus LMG 24374]AJC92124.1 flagellar secreted protein [Campylobacter subantarcticus LMG 24377]EAL3938450.1 flagellin [Campylobacter lari]MPB98620.1 flagellin [Campylobacter subantarcticus]